MKLTLGLLQNKQKGQCNRSWSNAWALWRAVVWLHVGSWQIFSSDCSNRVDFFYLLASIRSERISETFCFLTRKRLWLIFNICLCLPCRFFLYCFQNFEARHPRCVLNHNVENYMKKIHQEASKKRLTSILQATSSTDYTLTVLLLTVKPMNVMVFETSTSNCICIL
jgi:hypothetical protein